MSAARLMTDLARLGIRIEAHGDRLRYSPRSAVTPDLVDRMKAHKGELLAILLTGNEPEQTDGKWQTIYDTTHGEYDWINEAFN